MAKILRKEKLDYFSMWYRTEMIENTDQSIFPVLNQIIVDSVGISGLKEVKRRAWR